MSEQNIRDEIADEISGVVTGEGYYSTAIGIDAAQEAADLILASPVIRHIQAEALRKFRAELVGSQFVHYGIVLPDINEVVDELDEEADRIEKGE